MQSTGHNAYGGDATTYARLASKLPNAEEGQPMNGIITQWKRFLSQRRRKDGKTLTNVRRFRPF
jgi:hypothetical protein